MIIVVLSIMFYGCEKEVVVDGTYDASADYSDYVIHQALDWLSDAAMGDDFAIEGYFDIPTVSVNVVLMSDNSFTSTVDESTYADCKEAAYKGLASAMRDFVRMRYSAAGKGDDLSDEAIDAILVEEIGMSLDSYLREYGPSLMPTIEEVKEDYNVTAVFQPLPEE